MRRPGRTRREVIGNTKGDRGRTGSDDMRVGVAGVGRMGAAIAARLIEVGHQVTVWNRTRDKIKPLSDAGAGVAGSPAELAGKVEAIVTILTNNEALAAVYEGPSGLLAGDAKGKL